MEKHILTWASAHGDKTSVCIAKIKNTKSSIVTEIIFNGCDEGAVFLEDLIKPADYSTALNELKELRVAAARRQERIIKKVEKALGFKLYDWQKAFIFGGEPYGIEIATSRRSGKTLTHCLRLCLSEGEPIVATLKPAVLAQNEFLKYIGEDICTIQRSKYFIEMLKYTYNTLLSAGGIELREIIFK